MLGPVTGIAPFGCPVVVAGRPLAPWTVIETCAASGGAARLSSTFIPPAVTWLTKVPGSVICRLHPKTLFGFSLVSIVIVEVVEDPVFDPCLDYFAALCLGAVDMLYDDAPRSTIGGFAVIGIEFAV